MVFAKQKSLQIIHARDDYSTNLATKQHMQIPTHTMQVFTGCSLPSNHSAVLRLQPVKQALPSEFAVPHDIHLRPEALVAEMPLVYRTHISLTTSEVALCETAPRPLQHRTPFYMIPRLAAALAAIPFLREPRGPRTRAASIRIHCVESWAGYSLCCRNESFGRLQPLMLE